MKNGAAPIVVRLAEPSDDAGLRRVFCATPMDGAVQLALQRDPSYFDAGVVEGAFRQTLVGVAQHEVVAAGSRSVRTRYVNGAPRSVGYLGGLRCLEAQRGGRLLARGYAFLRRLHEDGRALLYVTTIAADNHVALRVLTTKRCGLPAYEPAGTYHTLVVRPRTRHARVPKGVHIRTATDSDVDLIVAFLGRVGPTRQLAPAYTHDDFLDPRGTFRDLRMEDIRLAFRGDRIVGTLGSWNQTAFRQTVVSGYAPALRWLRPLHNAWARLRGTARLPLPGSVLPYRTLAIPWAEDDDADVFRALLDTALDAHARDRADPSCGMVALGMHETDPLLPVAWPYRTRTYDARVFLVHWPDGQSAYEELREGPIYLELGCL